jgi:hypothetical protein
MSNETTTQENRRGGARPGSGRKPITPTDEDREHAETLAGFGLTEVNIAALVCGGISVATLRDRFAEELQRGRAKAHAGIGKTLFQKAMAGDVASLIWWTKTQMRWTEAPRQIEVSGNISITDALAQAQARLIEAEIVEMDDVQKIEAIGVTEPVTVDVAPVTEAITMGTTMGTGVEHRANPHES